MAFAVYKASAGSGKTFSLVREYIRILLEDPSGFRNILAITFTNKAANEMKQRVLRALTGLSRPDDPDSLSVRETLMPLLVRDTGYAPEQIALKAGEALTLILHNYSDFAIGTIDSFSHKLIRTFAHDFGLPVNFNVEVDSDTLLSTAVDLLLDRVGDDDNLTRLLVRFLETRMDEDKGWNIDTLLTGFAKNLLDDEGQVYIRRLREVTLDDFRRISEWLHARIRAFEKNVSGIAARAVRRIREAGIPHAAFFLGSRGIYKYFENVEAGRMDKLEPSQTLSAGIEAGKWHAGKASQEDKNAIDAIRDDLLAIYQELQSEIKANRPHYSLRRMLAGTIYPLAVLNEIEKVLADFKKQNNIVHISEFNTRIASVIMGEPVPFIYERLGEKYHHILIDEFQDTSAMQWMNFLPLVENALASGYFNLVVGDGKQAIYRWRNGDVRQFSSLPSVPGSSHDPLLLDRETTLRDHYREVNLNRNYRSKAEIVSFNNRFFSMLTRDLFTGEKMEIYKDLEQEFDPGKTGGWVGISFIDPEREQRLYDEITFERIVGIIRETVADNYSLKDIAILCRNNRNASEIARYLLTNGIDVISAESLLLSNSRAVNFLVGFFRYLFEPPNPVVMGEMTVFLIEHNVVLRNEMSVHQALRLITSVKDPEKGFRKLLTKYDYTIDPAQLGSLALYDLAETLIRLFRLNDPPDPYLQFFLDAVLQFTSKTSTAGIDFLEWWDNQKSSLSIIVPEGLDAVQIMTIHKAKGLQFPVVVYPFADELMRMTRDYLWIDLQPDEVPGLKSALVRTTKEMEGTPYSGFYNEEADMSLLDLVNVLYVALTRPEDRLHILAKMPSGKNESTKSLPAFFRRYLEEEGLFTEGQLDYSVGMKMPCSRKAGSPGEEILKISEMISFPWLDRVHVRLHAPDRWDPEDPAGNSGWGNRIHTLLSLVRTADDIPGVIADALNSGLVAKEDQPRIGAILTGIVSHPQLSRLFSDEVQARMETEILVPGGAFYRPDRVVTEDGKAWVIDYKTGRPNEKHRSQLNRYGKYLEEMGYGEVTRMLVYLEPKITVVKF